MSDSVPGSAATEGETMTTTAPEWVEGWPDDDTLARWWAELNRWEWPDDLPGYPPSVSDETEHRMVIRGAMALLNLVVDEPKRDAAWKAYCDAHA